ncbi:MAG: hypothetical protein ACYC97_02095 [Metallibacterium sp.]
MAKYRKTAKKRFRNNPAKKQDHTIRNILLGGGAVIGGLYLIGWKAGTPPATCNNPISCAWNTIAGAADTIYNDINGLVIGLAGYGGYKLFKNNNNSGNTPPPPSAPITFNMPLSSPASSTASATVPSEMSMLNYLDNYSSVIGANSSTAVSSQPSLFGTIGNFLNQDVWQPINTADQSASNWIWNGLDNFGNEIQNFYGNQGTTAGTLAGAGTTLANPATLTLGGL